jgi:hypothetical protein
MADFRGKRDIKAPDLSVLYRKYTSHQLDRILRLSDEVGEALNVLAAIDRRTHYRIVRKWIFVDLMWFIMQLQAKRVAIDTLKLTNSYERFEERRLAYTSRPEELLTRHRPDSSRLDRRLYDYIDAFRTSGGTRENLKRRNRALRAFCTDVAVDK